MNISPTWASRPIAGVAAALLLAAALKPPLASSTA